MTGGKTGGTTVPGPDVTHGHPAFSPLIVAFTCNWCSYAGADLAGISRIQYPPNLRVSQTTFAKGVESAVDACGGQFARLARNAHQV